MEKLGHLIAVDWGLTSFRAYLVAPDGPILRKVSSEDGTQAVAPGRFSQALSAICGSWINHYPDASIALVGMVGDKNGWVETSFINCPAGAAEMRRNVVSVSINNGRHAFILPGVTVENENIVTDIMRGEDVLALGSGVTNGIVCVPGNNAKWIKLVDGKIVSFITYVTGEMYNLLRKHSSLVRLADDNEEPSGFKLGLASAWRGENSSNNLMPAEAAMRSLGLASGPMAGSGSILNKIFELRTTIMRGRMSARQVWPYLSGILVGEEMLDGCNTFGSPHRVTIIADGPIATLYAKAFEERGVSTAIMGTERCLVDGLRIILGANESADASRSPSAAFVGTSERMSDRSQPYNTPGSKPVLTEEFPFASL
jgi:2-dehydro-3-deoxygalactonokinase